MNTCYRDGDEFIRQNLDIPNKNKNKNLRYAKPKSINAYYLKLCIVSQKLIFTIDFGLKNERIHQYQFLQMVYLWQNFGNFYKRHSDVPNSESTNAPYLELYIYKSGFQNFYNDL